jgi:hypothetical protein
MRDLPRRKDKVLLIAKAEIGDEFADHNAAMYRQHQRNPRIVNVTFV